jgi:hypothetical protein
MDAVESARDRRGVPGGIARAPTIKAIAYAVIVGSQEAAHALLHTTDEVEREIWLAIINKALEVHQHDQEQLAIVIANKLAKIFR